MAKSKAVAAPLHETEIQSQELAAIVGKSTRWIRQLTTEGVLKQSSRGKYILGEALQAYIEHAAGGKEDSKRPRFIDEKTEHERIKKEMAQLELEEKRKNLHTTADVLDAWGALMINFRERVIGLPPKMSGQLSYLTDEKEIRRLLEERLNDALFQLAKYDPLASDSG
ncbi:hypothetical protein SAMN05216312_102228 [Cohnella sp. OV330]|uniref:hypothetical protein n=1 Tax=Cohnella sp. OV330 TaxID=1855288 RepID=UPI0008F06EA1|nr:hypothetical protein [Cohnella sp. OV330]SFA91753.1 hypothetical protein SAMN05216312_102228 [Cohnella sp. OV330]